MRTRRGALARGPTHCTRSWTNSHSVFATNAARPLCSEEVVRGNTSILRDHGAYEGPLPFIYSHWCPASPLRARNCRQRPAFTSAVVKKVAVRQLPRSCKHMPTPWATNMYACISSPEQLDRHWCRCTAVAVAESCHAHPLP